MLEARPETSTYRLDLPEEMKKRRIHDIFNIARLKPHYPNDDANFPGRESIAPYDYGEPDIETGVEAIDAHSWDGKKLHFQVKWADGDTTWEPLSTVNDCIALDQYLALHGVDEPEQLGNRSKRQGNPTAGKRRRK